MSGKKHYTGETYDDYMKGLARNAQKVWESDLAERVSQAEELHCLRRNYFALANLIKTTCTECGKWKDGQCGTCPAQRIRDGVPEEYLNHE